MFRALTATDILRQERRRVSALMERRRRRRMPRPPVSVPKTPAKPSMTTWTGHWIYAPSEIIPP